MSTLKLWPKQQEAFEFARDLEAVALFCEQRTGKTFITLKLIEYWIENNDEPFCGLLVGLLNNKYSTWIEHINSNLPDIETFDDWELFKKAKGHRIFLTHYEQTPAIVDKLVRYKKFNWSCVDEGHRIANRGSKQSRAVARLHRIPRRILLTGTPIEKKPTDLFAQFRYLDQTVFGTNWADFENEYLDFATVSLEGIPPGGHAWKAKILQQRILKSKAEFRPEKLGQIVELIKPLSFRLEQQDVGITPAKVVPVRVTPRGVQRGVYDQLSEHSVATLPNGTTVKAPLRITQIIKLRQVANGFLYDEDEELHTVGSAKLRWIIKEAHNLSKPAVIFTAFKPDTDRVYETLIAEGYSVDKFDGSVKKKLRPNILRKFQSAKRDFIVCQIRTGGVGVDLWKSSIGIVYSMGHSFIDWDQAKSRMSSVNKSNPVKIIVLIAKETIDEDLYSLVIKKGQSGQSVLKQLIRRINNGKRTKNKSRKG